MCSIGPKIQYFRKRAGISQFDLESAIEASSGMVSRIENGRVDPSKETIIKIVEKLGLNKLEVDYLIGSNTMPVSSNEIDQACDEIRDYYSKKNVFAYMICDRQRVWAISQGFIRLFSPLVDEPDMLIQKMIGESLMRIMLDPSLQILNYLDPDSLVDMASYNLARYYEELAFIIDDDKINETTNYIITNDFLRKIWERAIKGDIRTSCLDSRSVFFRMKNIKIRVNYTREYLNGNRRFETIEYIPNNALLKFLSRF